MTPEEKENAEVNRRKGHATTILAVLLAYAAYRAFVAYSSGGISPTDADNDKFLGMVVGVWGTILLCIYRYSVELLLIEIGLVVAGGYLWIAPIIGQ